MAMNQTMADAFQGGSGINPATLKTVIVSITAAAFLLLLAWIVTRLWQDYQADQINEGEVFAEMIWLAAIVAFVLAFLGWY